MNRYTLVPLALFVACVTAPTLTPAERTTAQAVAFGGVAGCFDPIAYGAIPDDGLSDRVALQAAVDTVPATGGTVCVGPGVYDCERAPIGSYNRFACIATHGKHVTIRGAGPETVLRLAGDQGASTTHVISIDPSAEDVRVTDLTIDTAGSTNTDEQTHAIATGNLCSTGNCNPIRNVEVDHVRFIHPRNTPSRKGDCIRLLGNSAPTSTTPGTELWGVRVHDNTGDCARSFVEIQRGVHDLIVSGNNINCATCDQAVDGEATGVVSEVGRPSTVVISGNTFTDSPGVGGDFSIALTYVKGATITGNTMPRGIALFGSTGVVITGNTITSLTHGGDDGTIDVKKSCDGLIIGHNSLTRGGHIGPVVKVLSSSGVPCRGIAITGNTIVQGTAFHAIYGEAFSRATIAGNTITYGVSAPQYAAITVRSSVLALPVRDIKIAHNIIAGDVGPSYGVTLDCSPAQCGSGLSVEGNVATNTVFGLRVNHPENVTAPITSSGNSMGAGAYGTAPMQAGD